MKEYIRAMQKSYEWERSVAAASRWAYDTQRPSPYLP
jgi:hypothetical protein